MKIVLAILTEVAHLFADDGMLAAALLAWTATLGLGIWLSPKLASAPCAGDLVLGYAALLLSNVVRARYQR